MATNRDLRKQSFFDLEIDPRILADVPAGNNGQLAVVTDQVGMRLYVRIGGMLVPAIDASSSPGVALLDGRAGGQILHGGTAAFENLVLRSTFHVTKGCIDAQDRITNTLGILNLGTAATSSQGYGTGDVLLGGKLEVNGQTTLEGGAVSHVQHIMRTHCDLIFGNMEYVRFWTASTTEQFGLALHPEFGNALIIHQDQARALKDYDHAPTANPTVFIHSALNPDTNNSRYGSLSHSGTAGASGSFDALSFSGPMMVGKTTTPITNFGGTGDVCTGGSMYISGGWGLSVKYAIKSQTLTSVTIATLDAENEQYAMSIMTGRLAEGMYWGVRGGVDPGYGNNNLTITNTTNVYKNHGHTTMLANPRLWLHSQCDPTVNGTRFGYFDHTGTSSSEGSFNIGCGSGPIILGTTTTLPSGFADTGDVATGGDWYVAGSYTLGKRSIFVPSSVNSVAASTGITSSMLDKTLIKIQGDGGAVDITVNPQIAAGTDGQVIILKGDNSTNTVQIDDGDGLALNENIVFVMGKGDILQLYYDVTDALWYEISRSRNS